MDFAIETNGPFAPTWTSIAANVPGNGTPAWLRQAKFGIWFHYGPQANLQSGDWSAQHMYQPGADAYNFHTNNFGHPTTNGYKDVISAWAPTNYSPAGMAQLFYNAGARFVLVQGVHHDNFDNWNSRYNPWNMINFGAKRDTMAEWTNALHNLGMHMGVAFHHEYSWWFTQPDFLSDSTGPFAGVPYDAVTATNSAGTWWAELRHAPALQSGFAQISGHRHADARLLESQLRHFHQRPRLLPLVCHAMGAADAGRGGKLQSGFHLHRRQFHAAVQRLRDRHRLQMRRDAARHCAFLQPHAGAARAIWTRSRS